jgi:beta-glucanase (GH16 family)
VGTIFAELIQMKLLAVAVFLIAFQLAGQNIDSTADGIGKAKASMFFKRNLDIRNLGSKGRYRKQEKSTVRLAFPFESENYKQVFEDNFDSLNREVWGVGQPWGRFHGQFPHQYYGDTEVFTQNGILHLQNRFAPHVFTQADTQLTIPYGTGLINTWGSKNFTFGYFAIRSKNPTGPATWPAFWLTGKNNWPPEIDIFEMYGGCNGDKIHDQTMTLHFGKIENQTKTLWVKKMPLPDNTDSEFHIYSCLWEPGKVSFYTDGVEIKQFHLNQWMDQFYKEPMFIILNNAVDHRYLDCIKNDKLPVDFEIDWIRIYQKME